MLCFCFQLFKCYNQVVFPGGVKIFVNVRVAAIFNEPGVLGSLCLHEALNQISVFVLNNRCRLCVSKDVGNTAELVVGGASTSKLDFGNKVCITGELSHVSLSSVDIIIKSIVTFVSKIQWFSECFALNNSFFFDGTTSLRNREFEDFLFANVRPGDNSTFAGTDSILVVVNSSVTQLCDSDHSVLKRKHLIECINSEDAITFCFDNQSDGTLFLVTLKQLFGLVVVLDGLVTSWSPDELFVLDFFAHRHSSAKADPDGQ